MNKEKRNKRSKEKKKRKNQSIFYKKIKFLNNLIEKGNKEIENLKNEIEELNKKEIVSEEERAKIESTKKRNEYAIKEIENLVETAKIQIEKVKSSLKGL